ncbi:MAG: hypothetical protein JSS49_28930 [Planctomycetes bacterium]|nr:hypothetical protein [Planctomycetota bacterium]
MKYLLLEARQAAPGDASLIWGEEKDRGIWQGWLWDMQYAPVLAHQSEPINFIDTYGLDGAAPKPGANSKSGAISKPGTVPKSGIVPPPPPNTACLGGSSDYKDGGKHDGGEPPEKERPFELSRNNQNSLPMNKVDENIPPGTKPNIQGTVQGDFGPNPAYGRPTELGKHPEKPTDGKVTGGDTINRSPQVTVLQAVVLQIRFRAQNETEAVKAFD